jgi:hypothetical protein
MWDFRHCSQQILNEREEKRSRDEGDRLPSSSHDMGVWMLLLLCVVSKEKRIVVSSCYVCRSPRLWRDGELGAHKNWLSQARHGMNAEARALHLSACETSTNNMVIHLFQFSSTMIASFRSVGKTFCSTLDFSTSIKRS